MANGRLGDTGRSGLLLSTRLRPKPIFEAVNPLAPTQITNPVQLHDGLNAAKWYALDHPFAAGLWQSVPVANVGGNFAFSAWGLAQSGASVAFEMKIGIDPSG